MPLPCFELTGNLNEILPTNTGGELDVGPLTSVALVLTSNVKPEEFITWDGELYRVSSVHITVNADGTISDVSDPVFLLANDPDLNFSGLQWKVSVRTRFNDVAITEWWFNAPNDGEIVDLASVVPVPGAPVTGFNEVPVSGLSGATNFMKNMLVAADDAAEARSILGLSLFAIDDVVWFDEFADFPATGDADVVYGDRSDGKLYIWDTVGLDYQAIRGAVSATDIVDASASGLAVLTGTAAEGRDALERIQALRTGASLWSDLITDTHIHGGVEVDNQNRPVSVSAASVVTPGAANLLAGLLPFAGYNVGTNTLPTGLGVRVSNGTALKTLNAASDDALDITFNSAVGFNFCGGFVFFGYTPTVQTYLLSFTVELISTTSTGAPQVNVHLFDTVADTDTQVIATFYVPDPGPQRVVVRVPVTNVNQRFEVTVNDGQDIDYAARFIFTDFMLVPESTAFPKYGDILRIPPYGRESTTASDITLNIPDNFAGDHMVLVKTVERGWIAERGTLAAGSNSLAAVFSGASFTAEEIVAIPATVWQTGDLDVICEPAYESVRYHDDGTYFYPQSPGDASTMLAEAITPNLGIYGTDLPYASAMGIDRTTLHRFEARNNDRTSVDNAQGKTNERCEMGSGINIPFNTDLWISFWVNAGFVAPASFAILMQIHYSNDVGDTSGLSPDFSFGPGFGQGMQVVRRTDGGVPVLSGSGTPPGITTVTAASVPYEPGKWHRAVFQIQVSDVGGGYLGFWWDGVQILNSAAALGYNRDNGPVLRYGIYRSHSVDPLVAKFQHLEISTASLASRITAPLPI